MKYTFYAYTIDKKIKRGTIEADSLPLAEEALLQKGFQRVLNLQDVGGKKITKQSISLSLFGIKDSDILDFSREFGNLINAGISIITALELLEKETAKNAMRSVIKDLVSDIRAGRSLSEAMSKHPKVFSTTYIAVMKTSEQTGELAGGLSHMTEHIEKQENIRKRIRRALTYPLMVVIIAIGVSALLITAVLPPIIGMFESLGTDLPLITRFFVAIASFVVNNKFYLLAGFISLPIMFIVYMSTPSGRYNLDKFLLAIPQIGQIILKTNLLFFCRAAAILLNAGVSISNVLAACSTTIENRRICTAITEGENELLKGYPFSQAMEKTGLFSVSSIEALVVGERTGELETALDKLASYFERTSQEKMDNLISMIEPALTIVIGIAVALLAVAVIAPIYSLSGGL
ncbi:MAG: type II secretion system F family protein [Candidatus Hodarchaeota archaeon]